MVSNKDKGNQNRIINIFVLVALCAVIFYCIRYVRNGKVESVESEEYQVAVRGYENPALQQEEKKSDPYEGSFLPIRVSAKCESFSKEISLYVSEGICYAFLPAYTELTEVSYIFDDTAYEVEISGQAVAAGDWLQDIEVGGDYELVIRDPERNELHYNMVFMQSRNLPAMFIDTRSGSMNYVEADKGNEESGQFCCVTAQGEIDSQAAMERIRGRGNTSWEGPGGKNQYNVRLAERTDVLHMGSAQNWIVQANKLDVSMMRNKLAYDFARDIGIPYAVDSEFADLYFNGEYAGAYLVCEKVEAAKNRVEIGDGYLLEVNFRAYDSDTAFSTSRGNFVINAPELITEKEHNYIADYVSRVADSITLAPQSDEYLDYIDLTSFARLFIIDELGNDPDNNALSTFYYKEDETANTRLTAGPVWDFDIALGNDERCEEVLNSYYGEGWFEYLYRSEAFREEVAGQLQDIMENLYDKYENHYFDDITEYLEASYHMNEIRWKEKQGYIASYYPEYEGTMKYLDNYFMTRLKNLNRVFNGSEKMHKVEFLDRGRQYAHTFVKDGEVIPAQILQSLERIDSVTNYSLTNEQVIDPYTYVVYNDVRINCRPQGIGTAVPQADVGAVGVLVPGGTATDKGELAMQWISFIMLMVPGLISVWVSGNTKVKKDNAFAVLTQYLLNSFIVLLLAYAIFYVLYGSAVLSFSDIYSESYDYSIYNVNVAFKYLLLSGGLAVAVGVVERIFAAFVHKKKVSQ